MKHAVAQPVYSKELMAAHPKVAVSALNTISIHAGRDAALGAIRELMKGNTDYDSSIRLLKMVERIAVATKSEAATIYAARTMNYILRRPRREVESSAAYEAENVANAMISVGSSRGGSAVVSLSLTIKELNLDTSIILQISKGSGGPNSLRYAIPVIRGEKYDRLIRNPSKSKSESEEQTKVDMLRAIVSIAAHTSSTEAATLVVDALSEIRGQKRMVNIKDATNSFTDIATYTSSADAVISSANTYLLLSRSSEAAKDTVRIFGALAERFADPTPILIIATAIGYQYSRLEGDPEACAQSAAQLARTVHSMMGNSSRTQIIDYALKFIPAAESGSTGLASVSRE